MKLSNLIDSENTESESNTSSFAVIISVILIILAFLIITGLLVWFFILKHHEMESEKAEEGSDLEIDHDQIADFAGDSLSWIGNSANFGQFWADPIGHSRMFDLELEETHF
jgi:flagellar basal body-associated protein FliL